MAAAACIVAVACTAAVAPALGGTATASIDNDYDPDVLEFTAAPGEKNDLTIELSEDETTWTVTDAGAPVTAGPGCEAGSDPNTVTCAADGPGFYVQVETSDRADTVSLPDACCFVDVYGGLGADVVEGGLRDSRFWGGPGRDRLTGNGNLYGEEGDDILTSYGIGYLDGGVGSDTITAPRSCRPDPGPDAIAVYVTRLLPVTVTLDGRRNDGEPGERDLVRTANVVGGHGDDRLVGDRCDNRLGGGNGNDVVSGKGGGDTLYGDHNSCGPGGYGPTPFPEHDGDDRLYGGRGNDFAWGCAGNDRIRGGDYSPVGSDDDDLYGDSGRDQLSGVYGRDALFGAEGGDRLNGGPNRDFMQGSWGNDVFRARDGFADRIWGGRDRDVARVDFRLDEVHSAEQR